MRPRILVVGDPIVDRYLHHRVVKEMHGVPVIAVQQILDQSGGCTAVAEMCAALGADVDLACSSQKSLKVRYVVDHKTLLRRDEDAFVLGDEAKSVLLGKLTGNHDIILVSDYGKGMVTAEVIALCVQSGARVLADPYPGVGPETYHGCHCVCPSWSAYAAYAEQWSSLERICVKMDDHGIFVKEFGTTALIPALDVQAVDSCGAGDQFMAALAVMLANGNDLFGAASFANVAAGLKCTKTGTTPVRAEELARAMREMVGTTLLTGTRLAPWSDML